LVWFGLGRAEPGEMGGWAVTVLDVGARLARALAATLQKENDPL
jgi:hypothetical protein